MEKILSKFLPSSEVTPAAKREYCISCKCKNLKATNEQQDKGTGALH